MPKSSSPASFNEFPFKFTDKCYTISDSDGINNITDDQHNILNEFANLLKDSIVKDKAKILYRGDNSNILSPVYNTTTSESLYHNLFYYGIKSKRATNNDNGTVFSYNFDKTVTADFDYIFITFNKLLSSNNTVITNFRIKETDFCAFFSNNDNKKCFMDNAMANADKHLLRNIYFFLLHNYDSNKYFNSFYLSSTFDHSTAVKYAKYKNDDNGIISYYFTSSPLYNTGLTIKSVIACTSKFRRSHLPTFHSLFNPDDFEYVIKCGMFPHYLLAVKECASSRIIINPYLFRQGTISMITIKNGFNINQNNFNNEILDTNFTNYFELNNETSKINIHEITR